MILPFTTKFGNKKTEFVEKILQQPGYTPKIHTLREDKNNKFRKGMDLHMATDYRTKKYHQFNVGYPSFSKVTSTQRIFMSHYDGILQMTVENYLAGPVIDDLIINDGFTGELNRNDFIRWFFPKGEREWIGKIIHWTEFRY